MSSNRVPNRSGGFGTWLEYVLILILVILVAAIIVSLFGPYLKNEVTEFLINQGLPVTLP